MRGRASVAPPAARAQQARASRCPGRGPRVRVRRAAVAGGRRPRGRGGRVAAREVPAAVTRRSGSAERPRGRRRSGRNRPWRLIAGAQRGRRHRTGRWIAGARRGRRHRTGRQRGGCRRGAGGRADGRDRRRCRRPALRGRVERWPRRPGGAGGGPADVAIRFSRGGGHCHCRWRGRLGRYLDGGARRARVSPAAWAVNELDHYRPVMLAPPVTGEYRSRTGHDREDAGSRDRRGGCARPECAHRLFARACRLPRARRLLSCARRLPPGHRLPPMRLVPAAQEHAAVLWYAPGMVTGRSTANPPARNAPRVRSSVSLYRDHSAPRAGETSAGERSRVVTKRCLRRPLAVGGRKRRAPGGMAAGHAGGPGHGPWAARRPEIGGPRCAAVAVPTHNGIYG